MSLGVGLSLPLPLGVSKEARGARLPSRVVAITGFVLAPALALVGELVLSGGSDSVLDNTTLEFLSLFITSARAFPTERVIVDDSRFGRDGREGELI